MYKDKFTLCFVFVFVVFSFCDFNDLIETPFARLRQAYDKTLPEDAEPVETQAPSQRVLLRRQEPLGKAEAEGNVLRNM